MDLPPCTNKKKKIDWIPGFLFQIRLAEAQKQKSVQGELKPEQLVKLAKLEDWHKELKLLEDEKN